VLTARTCIDALHFPLGCPARGYDIGDITGLLDEWLVPATRGSSTTSPMTPRANWRRPREMNEIAPIQLSVVGCQGSDKQASGAPSSFLNPENWQPTTDLLLSFVPAP
jgi:hypothetical protein